MVERAHVDVRPFAARAAVLFLAVVREHAVESTAAVVHLASAAWWFALEELLRERCFSLGPTDEGFADALKAAQLAANAARLGLREGLDLEQRSRAERPGDAAIDLAARVAELGRARPRREPDDDQDEPEPEEPDDQREPDPAVAPPGAAIAAEEDDDGAELPPEPTTRLRGEEGPAWSTDGDRSPSKPAERALAHALAMTEEQRGALAAANVARAGFALDPRTGQWVQASQLPRPAGPPPSPAAGLEQIAQASLGAMRKRGL